MAGKNNGTVRFCAECYRSVNCTALFTAFLHISFFFRCISATLMVYVRYHVPFYCCIRPSSR